MGDHTCQPHYTQTEFPQNEALRARDPPAGGFGECSAFSNDGWRGSAKHTSLPLVCVLVISETFVDSEGFPLKGTPRSMPSEDGELADRG